MGRGGWSFVDDGRGCFGHSQEVVGSASGHMGFTAARGGVKLKAEETEETSLVMTSFKSSEVRSVKP